MRTRRLSIREAARYRRPLDGADAQALEGALAQAERELEQCKELLVRATSVVANRRQRWFSDAVAFLSPRREHEHHYPPGTGLCACGDRLTPEDGH